MARPATFSICPLRSDQGGFSLVELLVVLAVLAICAALAAPSMGEAVDHTQGRATAQTWQAAATWAQLRQLALGDSARLTASPEGLWLAGPDASACQIDGVGADVATNVTRWRRGSEVRVTFGGASAAPDSAGSLYFGHGERATRVVVRVESGLTRRTTP